MIIDVGTDIIYFSGLLPKRHPAFFKRLSALLKLKGVKYGLLSDTEDIWCRDYMPIQVSNKYFVQFKYDPSYLHSPKKYIAIIPDKTLQAIRVKPVISDIKIDGGNVVKSRKRVIMTERVFKENPCWSKVKLVKEIEKLLKVERAIIIPDCPGDEIGHADGIVRFIEAPYVASNTVFVTDFSGMSPKYFSKLMRVLSEEDLLPVILPYDYSCAKNKMDATGIYINFIQAGKTVIFPTFGIKEDMLAESRFRDFFGLNAFALRSNEIAEEGGVLNCISWGMSGEIL